MTNYAPFIKNSAHQIRPKMFSQIVFAVTMQINYRMCWELQLSATTINQHGWVKDSTRVSFSLIMFFPRDLQERQARMATIKRRSRRSWWKTLLGRICSGARECGNYKRNLVTSMNCKQSARDKHEEAKGTTQLVWLQLLFKNSAIVKHIKNRWSFFTHLWHRRE